MRYISCSLPLIHASSRLEHADIWEQYPSRYWVYLASTGKRLRWASIKFLGRPAMGVRLQSLQDYFLSGSSLPWAPKPLDMTWQVCHQTAVVHALEKQRQNLLQQSLSCWKAGLTFQNAVTAVSFIRWYLISAKLTLLCGRRCSKESCGCSSMEVASFTFEFVFKHLRNHSSGSTLSRPVWLLPSLSTQASCLHTAGPGHLAKTFIPKQGPSSTSFLPSGSSHWVSPMCVIIATGEGMLSKLEICVGTSALLLSV